VTSTDVVEGNAGGLDDIISVGLDDIIVGSELYLMCICHLNEKWHQQWQHQWWLITVAVVMYCGCYAVFYGVCSTALQFQLIGGEWGNLQPN